MSQLRLVPSLCFENGCEIYRPRAALIAAYVQRGEHAGFLVPTLEATPTFWLGKVPGLNDAVDDDGHKDCAHMALSLYLD